MQYKRINLELIVIADEADGVVAELNTMLDDLEQRHSLFGGEIEAVGFKHTATPRKSALGHTKKAGETVAVAVRTARDSVSVALRAVVG